MKTQLKLASLAALTAATLALPAAAQDNAAPAKCAPSTMSKCGAKKQKAKSSAKCAAAKCGAKCAPKCAPKCGPKR